MIRTYIKASVYSFYYRNFSLKERWKPNEYPKTTVAHCKRIIKEIQ